MPGKTDILAGAEVVVDQFEVTVIDGIDAGESVRSRGADIVIGTERGCDLILSDTSVSGFHCRLTATDNGVQVIDEGSTNGTTVAGVRIESAFVSRSATVELGLSVVEVRLLDDKVKHPLSTTPMFGDALGRSPAMRRIFALLGKIAATDQTILFEGETGTGKGMLAKAVHDASARKDGPFVVVDCGALPRGLFESELFGHVAGAFTGATKPNTGLMRSADGGTVFLDELGELPLDLQPKLLRVLEQRAVRPVGGGEPIPVDIRLVAATNRNLHREVNEGRFRVDLFYRLGSVRLRVPALRDRKDDIGPLVRHFYALCTGGDEPTDEFVAGFRQNSWPGNIRELRSSVERATLLGDLENWLDVNTGTNDQGQVVFDPEVPFRVSKLKATNRWERAYLEALMEFHGENLSRAARGARMDRSYLRQLLRRHGLRE